VSRDSTDSDNIRKTGPTRAAKIAFRVVLFSLLVIEGAYFLWVFINSPSEPDSTRGLIFEIPIGRRGGGLYVDRQNSFAFWGAVFLTLALTIFGTVKGFIKDVFLDKRPE